MVWSPACLLHQPSAEVWVGVPGPGSELPERADRMLAALPPPEPSWHHRTRPHADDLLRAVHDPGLVARLRACTSSGAAGSRGAAASRRVVPYVFPTAGMLGGLPVREPAAMHARAGRWCYDTMTLVGAGTWPAAHAAVDCALTRRTWWPAAPRSAYALGRPPGHHVTRDGFGGSCYLNNAAVAVEALRRAGADRVAVVDIDAHHGNGTQAIHYRRADVWYGSLHVDPGAGWFPHYAGFADETGAGPGLGTTSNVPLAPGAGDGPWLAAVARLVDGCTGSGRTPWWSRSGWTPRRPTRRARCR